jgi:NAD(P)-dependent dehydrogenase (short-subunit alcohol dehydrogenase family)
VANGTTSERCIIANLDRVADLSRDVRENALRQIPMRKPRFGTPEEIAQAALFLARNEYANNCVINLDGGLSAV